MPAVEALNRPDLKPKAVRQTSKLPDERKPHQCIVCGCVYPNQIDYFPKIRMTIPQSTVFLEIGYQAVGER